MEARATWKKGLAFDGWGGSSGFTLPLGSSSEPGDDEAGFRPLELLLVGLAGCTGMDVISILEKKRQEVTDFEVYVQADRTEDHPRVFTHIVIQFTITGRAIDQAAVERAVALSATKYCSVQAILSKSASVEHKIIIKEG
jgi:putative redox protein